MHAKKFILLILLCFLPSHASATQQESVSFVALEYNGIIQQNGKGAYNFFIEDLSTDIGITFDYEVMSPVRGTNAFYNQEKECMIPSSNHVTYFEKHQVIHSVSFAQINYLAFTLPEKPLITNKEQMRYQVIGVLRDEHAWNYQQRFDIPDATYVKVGSLKSLVELLYRKRIDVAIHDQHDFLAMTNYFKRPKPNYSEANPMAVDDIVITCHASEKTQRFIDTVNPRLIEQVGLGFDEYFERVSAN